MEEIRVCQKDLLAANQKPAARLLERAEIALLEKNSAEALLLLAQSEASLLCQKNPPKEALETLALARVKLAALEADKEREQGYF